MEQRPWSEMDPEQFAEGGFSRERWEAYRTKCSDAYPSLWIWKTSKGCVMMLHLVTGRGVTWGGVRPATAEETAARAKAAATGIACRVPDGVFTISIQWRSHAWKHGYCEACDVLAGPGKEITGRQEMSECKILDMDAGVLSRGSVHR